MHRNNYDYKEIVFNRRCHNHKLKVKELPEDVIGIEDPIWYDGIFCYQDKQWNRYSTRAHIPIGEDEMCRYWCIYKVKQIIDWDWPYNYHYEIISTREDNAS